MLAAEGLDAVQCPGHPPDRYMDDIVVFGPDREAMRGLRDQVQAFVSNQLHLEVKAEATVLAPVTEGIPFLGFRIWRGLIRFDRARARRFRRHFRALLGAGLPQEVTARRASSLVAWACQADTAGFRRAFLQGLVGRGLPSGGVPPRRVPPPGDGYPAVAGAAGPSDGAAAESWVQAFGGHFMALRSPLHP